MRFAIIFFLFFQNCRCTTTCSQPTNGVQIRFVTVTTIALILSTNLFVRSTMADARKRANGQRIFCKSTKTGCNCIRRTVQEGPEIPCSMRIRLRLDVVHECFAVILDDFCIFFRHISRLFHVLTLFSYHLTHGINGILSENQTNHSLKNCKLIVKDCVRQKIV